jgi:hypothetical protein
VPGFVHQLEQLVREQHLDARVRLETVEGCVTVVRSEPLADALNSLYQSRDAPRIDESWTIDESGRRRRNETLWAGPQLFRGAARELELAYVAGAYARYGHGEDLRFANARQKVALIASLLNELGCANVHVESTEGVIPQTNTIHFEPTPELRGRMAHPPL